MSEKVPRFRRVKAAFLSQMAKELASRHIFHENVQVLLVLTNSFEANLGYINSTIMGWLSWLMISHSLMMWSVCLDSMISAFFMVLTHKMAQSFFLRASLTFPKDPDPSKVSMLKSLSFKTFFIFSLFPSIMDFIRMNIRFLFQFVNQVSRQLLYIIFQTTKMAHHGYDKDRFTSLGFDEFDCIICCEVAMDPMECDSCGKIFCKICISDWISKNSATKCPNRCNSQITPIRSKALLKVYKNLDIRCSNSQCKKVVKLQDLASHEAICLRPKCWNFAVCEKPVNEYIMSEKPCCSNVCSTLLAISQNFGDVHKMYEIISSLAPKLKNANSITTTSDSTDSLGWDTKKFGTGIIISENNTHAFLKEQAYVFRTVFGNVGFTSGINYWEIIADARTENQLKIGVCSSKDIPLNSAFCDHPAGWAYYGLGQLRHGSNATGAAFGKRFKKQGILGVCLNMNNGTLSFSLNGENMGVAFKDEKLKSGVYYPAIALLHCAGCKIRGGVPIPSYFR